MLIIVYEFHKGCIRQLKLEFENKYGTDVRQKEGPSRVSRNAPLPTAIAYQMTAYNFFTYNLKFNEYYNACWCRNDSVKVNFSQDTKGF